MIATIKIQCDHSNYIVLSAWPMSSSQFLTLIQDFFLFLKLLVEVHFLYLEHFVLLIIYNCETHTIVKT